MKKPVLDKRTYTDILDQALRLAKTYFPTNGSGDIQWDSIKEPVNKDDPAYSLMEIFTRLMELLIRRLNKIPIKNFLSFLEMVGVEQQVGSPAEVPVTFLPAKSARTGGDIPAATQVATTQTDTADAQVFETRDAFYASAAILKEVVNLNPGKDKYSRLSLIELPPEPETLADHSRTITALEGDGPLLFDIDHVIYLGSESLFKREEPAALVLEITLSAGNKEIFSDENINWKIYNEDSEDWEDIEPGSDSYSIVSNNKVQINIDPFNGTGKSEINGIEDSWIACFFTGEFTGEIEAVEISEIRGQVLPAGGTLSDQFTTKTGTAFSNDTPIDPTKPVYPFGQRPQYGDAFYIGSKQAFSPDIQSLTLKFTIHPYSDAELKEIYKNIKTGSAGAVTVNTIIGWEYLDSSEEWQSIEEFQHSFTFKKTGAAVNVTRSAADVENKNGTLLGDGTSPDIEITFPSFGDIELKEVNKEENYWIRAVVKSFTPYGKDARLESTGNSNQPYVVIGPTFIPPIIENIEILYTYKDNKKNIHSIQTKNNFEFTVQKEKETQTAVLPFKPFIPVTSYRKGDKHNFLDEQPALYLGFDKEFGDVYTSMFFHVEDAESLYGYALEQGNPLIKWEYAAADYSWKPLDVKDNTADLTSGGTVAFTGPSDSIKINLFDSLLQQKEEAGMELYWYRARLADGHYDYPPAIKGIYLNTVMADQQYVAAEDQVTGSGNGTANQKINLIRLPITGGEVWVKEAEIPCEEDLENHLQEFRKLREESDEIEITDVIQKKSIGRSATAADDVAKRYSSQKKSSQEKKILTNNSIGDGKEETWIRWFRVANFFSSGPTSRCYTLDAVNGEITFGDGENGLIPPAGKDNIIIRSYRTGGGEKANKAASPLSVQELKSSLPFIDKVFNIQNAVGGSDSWSLDDTMEFGPQSIKHRDRAVTSEDCEWMVLQQFSQVARVRCIPTKEPAAGGRLDFKPGSAAVIIVPKSSERKPLPSKGLLRNIRDYLRTKALSTIFSGIHVIGPGFEEINIHAVVKPVKPEESSMVERRIIIALEAFFHPLTGGEKGQGWEFGRDVYISEVYAVIERTPGVDYVKDVDFIGRLGEDYVDVGTNSLVYSGTHDIKMETE